MNIKGMSKAKILTELFNGASPIGMGAFHKMVHDMNEGNAEQIIERGQVYFDYLHGRPLKIDLSGDELDTYLYNRDNGEGKAEEIIGKIK